MAEFEELEEKIADALDHEGEEDAEISKLAKEEKAELERAEALAKKEVANLKTWQAKMKEISESAFKALKNLPKFIIKNVAIGAIFFGISYFLEKLIKKSSSSEEKEGYGKKKAVILAIADLIKAESDLCTNFNDWLTSHKNDQISLAGFTIPLISIFELGLDPIEADGNNLTTLANKLIDGKTFNIPTIDQLDQLFTITESFIKDFDSIQKMIETKKSQVRVLEGLSEIISKEALQTIRDDLGVVRQMPYA